MAPVARRADPPCDDSLFGGLGWVSPARDERKRPVSTKPWQDQTVLSTPMFVSERRRLVDLAAKNRLPTVFSFREYVDAGGLMSYGPNLADLFRRAATYVDKILKGAQPADLPIEQPTKLSWSSTSKRPKRSGSRSRARCSSAPTASSNEPHPCPPPRPPHGRPRLRAARHARQAAAARGADGAGTWLDTWRGVGDVVTGTQRQRTTTSSWSSATAAAGGRTFLRGPGIRESGAK